MIFTSMRYSWYLRVCSLLLCILCSYCFSPANRHSRTAVDRTKVASFHKQPLAPRTPMFQLDSTIEEYIDGKPAFGGIDRLQNMAYRLIHSLQNGLSGDSTELAQLLSACCKWDNPCVSSKKELLEGLQQFAEYFGTGSIVCFSANPTGPNTIELSYQISFTYPLPWRPRVIIPARALVSMTLDSDSKCQITAVKESWDVSVLDIFLGQVFPRWWDVWHAFSSPVPEHPPIKTLARLPQKVDILELPETICAESRWQGAAKYPGPPVLAIPGFALFGRLTTSLRRRDNYNTVLPVEVQSGKYRDPKTGEDMKQTSWLFHVPTELQHQVINFGQRNSDSSGGHNDGGTGDADSHARTAVLQQQRQQGQLPQTLGHRKQLETPSLLQELDAEAADAAGTEEDDDVVEEVDYQVGFENLSVMRSVTGGAKRGLVNLDPQRVSDFEAQQKIDFAYRVLPRRLVAALDLRGKVDAQAIARGLRTIRAVVAEFDSSTGGTRASKAFQLTGKRVMIRSGLDSAAGASSQLLSKDATATHASNGSTSSSPRTDIELEQADTTSADVQPTFCLQLWSTKACFNKAAEPSMAVYEMQYNSKRTTLFVELELLDA